MRYIDTPITFNQWHETILTKNLVTLRNKKTIAYFFTFTRSFCSRKETYSTPSTYITRVLFILSGLVFLQYRNETKRALLPNEITSIDTVKALFVRSFPKQLTMEYLDSPQVKIYIHDSSKDMFYELEDLR